MIKALVQPLAPMGNSQLTNLSRTISLSIIDQFGDEISLETASNHSIEFFIPRDPHTPVPSMIVQNVTSLNGRSRFFHYHLIDLSPYQTNTELSQSLHIEIHPLNINLSYLLTYQFDTLPDKNEQQVIGWSIFCSKSKNHHQNEITNLYRLDLSSEDTFVQFIDNQHLSNHHSVIIGIRELKSEELAQFSLETDVLPTFDEFYHFTNNYELRVYMSGCYYLDEDNEWRSNGLIVRSPCLKNLCLFLWIFQVGPLTNYNYTHCLSTHLKN